MFKAVKGNKAYKIDESMKQSYLEDGYDIYKDGKLLNRTPKTTVSYTEYEKVLAENEKIKKEISKLKAGKAGE